MEKRMKEFDALMKGMQNIVNPPKKEKSADISRDKDDLLVLKGA